MLVSLYSLSVTFDILQFFLLLDRTEYGFSITVSRALQILVILVFFFRGSFQLLPLTFNLKMLYFLNLFFSFGSIFIFFLASPLVFGKNSFTYPVSIFLRGFVDLALFIYYFVFYFVIGRSLLSRKESFIKFLAVLNIGLLFSLFIGYADMVLKLFDVNVLARHIAYYPNIVDIGFRFHGLFGEPRDAVPSLILGVLVHFLRITVRQKRFSYSDFSILLLYSVAVLLTQSVSGLFGIALGFVLFIFSSFFAPKSSRFFLRLTGITSFFIVSIVTLSGERLIYYIGVYGDLSFVGRGFDSLSFDETTQMFNIFPILYFATNIINNWVLSIFGYGAGSSAALNLIYGMSGVSFPSSDLVRLLVEKGVIGLFLYVLFFIYFLRFRLDSIRLYRLNASHFLFCLVLGCCLLHRSYALWPLIFIYFMSYSLPRNSECNV